jgi:hypothetical protein
VLILMMRESYDAGHLDGLRWHNIYITSFVKIVTGVQAILKSCFRNLSGCTIGFSDGEV